MIKPLSALLCWGEIIEINVHQDFMFIWMFSSTIPREWVIFQILRVERQIKRKKPQTLILNEFDI